MYLPLIPLFFSLSLSLSLYFPSHRASLSPELNLPETPFTAVVSVATINRNRGKETLFFIVCNVGLEESR